MQAQQSLSQLGTLARILPIRVVSCGLKMADITFALPSLEKCAECPLCIWAANPFQKWNLGSAVSCFPQLPSLTILFRVGSSNSWCGILTQLVPPVPSHTMSSGNSIFFLVWRIPHCAGEKFKSAKMNSPIMNSILHERFISLSYQKGLVGLTMVSYAFSFLSALLRVFLRTTSLKELWSYSLS